MLAILTGREIRPSTILFNVHQANSALFLGTLHKHWSEAYDYQYSLHPQQIGSETRSKEVLCTNSESVALEDTFFPVRELCEIANDVGTRNTFPFVQLKESFQQIRMDVLGELQRSI